MPVLDGLETTRLLREMGYPYLIVGLTGKFHVLLNSYFFYNFNVSYADVVRVVGNAMDDDILSFESAGAGAVAGLPLRELI